MQDLRDAWRALRATPLVSAVAVLSLALGIGANTAMFTIVDSLVLRTLPVPNAERIVTVSGVWTNPFWEQIRDRPQLFEAAAAWSGDRFNLAESGEAQNVSGLWVSGRYFDVFGVKPILGRMITPADDRRGGGTDGPVAVISHRFWQSRYAGATDVIGKSLTVNGHIFTVVGVAPPQFFGAEVGQTFDVAIPIGADPLIRGSNSFLDARSTWWLTVMALLHPGQTPTAATAALRAVQPQIREATLPDWRPEDLGRYLGDPLSVETAATGRSWLRDQYQRPLLTLMVVVGLVLLIACGNIANLLLARATARRHEISVRQALGASRWRLGRQLLSESLLLSALGAAGGVLVAVWGSRLLVHQLMLGGNPVFLELGFDWRTFAFVAAVAIATALLFGTAPALRAARVAPIEAIKDQGRTTSGRITLGSGLVVGQVALSLVLVIGAGLFVRTFAALSTLRLGFDREQVLVFDIDATRTGADSTQLVPLYDRMRRAVQAVPGVAGAATSAITPVSNAMWNETWQVDGEPSLPDDKSLANANALSPGWFAAMKTPLVLGRDFTEQDRLGAPFVAVVNQAFVKRFLGTQKPLGRVLKRTGGPRGEGPPPVEIVGVVGDAVYASLREEIPPTVYLPIAQQPSPWPFTGLTVRTTAASPLAMSGSVGRAITGVDPKLAFSYRTLSSLVDNALVQEKLVAMLSAFFGGLALLLAGLGLYGVTSYAVNRRRAEIGIRLAIGTPPAGVLRLVLQRVATQVGLGVVIGAAVSWYASRFVEKLLYGLAPQDPLTLVLAATVLVAVGALAGWLPARRAARIDPAIVLREG